MGVDDTTFFTLLGGVLLLTGFGFEIVTFATVLVSNKHLTPTPEVSLSFNRRDSRFVRSFSSFTFLPEFF